MVADKTRENRLRWFGHVVTREELKLVKNDSSENKRRRERG